MRRSASTYSPHSFYPQGGTARAASSARSSPEIFQRNPGYPVDKSSISESAYSVQAVLSGRVVNPLASMLLDWGFAIYWASGAI